MNEPEQPYDASSPSRLEKRLHSLKPRPPLLDIEAIAKVADAKLADQVGIAIVPQSKSWYSKKTFAGTIAASWVCGVAVGASVVFFALSSGHTTEAKLRVAGSDLIEQSHEATTSKPTSSTLMESNMAERSMLAQSDLVGWDLVLGTEPLQVGMSLRSRYRLVRTGARASTNAMVRHLERGSSDLQNTIGPIEDASTQLPTVPITQSELLKSLLQDTNKDIH
jgi:hypothetical protein